MLMQFPNHDDNDLYDFIYLFNQIETLNTEMASSNENVSWPATNYQLLRIHVSVFIESWENIQNFASPQSNQLNTFIKGYHWQISR